MEEFLNKKVFIKIRTENKPIFFTATITTVTETHITFIDKFNESQMFLISDIIQIKELNGGGRNDRG